MSKSHSNSLARAIQRINGAMTKVRDAGGVRSATGAALRMIRREGLRGAVQRIGGMSREAARYSEWVARYDAPDAAALESLRRELDEAGVDTLISVVVPVFNTPARFLREMIESVLCQSYTHWELCIANDASTEPHVRALLDDYARRDARIRIVHRGANGHISEASNSALALARGAFVALLDHDDLLPPQALSVVARYIHAHPAARLFYSDEDKLSEDGRRHTPHFKPNWDPELILQYNVFSHLGVFETQLMRDVGGFRKGLEGSQDHDLLLRCLRAAGNASVVHIPHVLYHWRTIEGSTSISVDEKPYAMQASIRAITEYVQECGVRADVVAPQSDFPFVRVSFALPTPTPAVHVLVAHAGDVAALARCLKSVVSTTVYGSMHVSIVCVAGGEAGAAHVAASFPQVRVVAASARSVSIGQALNETVGKLGDDFVCLIDERVEITDSSWLEQLMQHACRPEIGAVGGSLWLGNGRLYSGGLILTSEHSAVPIHAGIARRSAGYFGRAMLTQTVSAVSWSCAAVRRAHFMAAGGFATNPGEDWQRNVSLGLRISAQGLRNIFVPRANVLVNTEGTDAIPHEVSFRDRSYNPNLALDAEDRAASFQLAFPPRIQIFE